jgi:ABC-type Na+ efflux pump permease subunit
MPEALQDTNWKWTPYIFPFIVPLFCIICVRLTSRAIESDEKNSYSRRGKTLEFFKNDIFNKISFFKNPIFLKEMVSFRTDILGLIPGILVFIVLWLAPCFYCISDVSVFGRSHLHLRDRQLTVVPDTQVPSTSGQSNQNTGNSIAVTNNRGETFILENHKKDLCLRMFLYEFIAIPLPVDGYYSYENQSDIQSQQFSQNRQIDNSMNSQQTKEYNASGKLVNVKTYNYHQPRYNQEINNPEPPVTLGLTHDALIIGFYISSVLILIYLVIRCSGFLCSTYQTEKNKLTWDVLRLTGLSNEDIVTGKLLGVLFLPLLQMSLAFLVLSFWVIEGAVTFSGALYFYIFCIAASMVAGLLGQYNSLKYKTAHESQGHTIATVLVYGFLLFMVSLFISGFRAFRSYDEFGGLYYNMDGWVKICGLLVCAGSLAFFLISNLIPSIKRHGILVFAFGLLFFIETMAGYVSYIPFLNPMRNKSLLFGNLFMEKGGYLPLISGDSFVFILSMLFLYCIGRWLWTGIIDRLNRDA